MSTKKATMKLSDDKFADKVLRDIKRSKPLLTKAEMDAIESTWNSMRNGRRCQLAMFTRSGKFLIDKVESDREFAVLAAQVQAHTEASISFYQGLVDLLKATALRTSVVLCYRTDMQDVLKEGKQRYLAEDASSEGA